MPAGYDEGVDINAIERFSLVEGICRRPGMYISKGDLRGILAWMDGYEVATGFAFGDNPIPDHYDMSPTDAMDSLARAAGYERNGRPIFHSDLDRIIEHYGSEDAVIEAMTANEERLRMERRMERRRQEETGKQNKALDADA